jgi:endonuclease-3
VKRRSGYLRAERIYNRLQQTYPEAKCALLFSNPLQLLIATILSAQSTDRTVNTVTPALFKRFKKADQFAAASPGELEALIRPSGFFRTKARHIQNACRIIAEKHGGQVPATMPELLELPGVARKTANVVLGVGFNHAEGVVVDTHVQRLSRRLDFSRETRPEKIEQDLMKLFPHDNWILLSHLLIYHGRALCTALRPKCAQCPLEDLCKSEDKTLVRSKI